MSAMRIILGDQLSFDMSALAGLDPARDIVLMMEVMEENTYVRHHKQKIVLILSAMRHFAYELRQRGVSVDYVHLDATENTGNLTTEVQRAVARHEPGCLVVTEPGEWRVQVMVEGWATLTGRPVEVRADGRFLASRARFAAWARGRRTWRMVGGVFHRVAVHDRVLRPDSEPTTVATTKCTKGGCKLDVGRRMPGAA